MTPRTTAVLRVLAVVLACAAVLLPITVASQAPADTRAGGWTPLQRDETLGQKALNRTIRDFISASRAERAYRAAHPNEPRTPPAPR